MVNDMYTVHSDEQRTSREVSFPVRRSPRTVKSRQ